MQRALGIVTLANTILWILYMLFMGIALVRLWTWMPLGTVMFLALPMGVLSCSFWLYSRGGTLLGLRTALLGQTILAAMGCVFIVSILMPRA